MVSAYPVGADFEQDRVKCMFWREGIPNCVCDRGLQSGVKIRKRLRIHQIAWFKGPP